MAEAERAFRRVLELDPKHAPALNGLGVLAHQCGRGNVAIELIGQAIAVNDRVPQYHYNIALVFDALGRADQAMTHYRRAVALKPDYAEAHNNLATALATKGQYSEAVTHFRRALARRAIRPTPTGISPLRCGPTASRTKRWTSSCADLPSRRPTS